MAALERVGHAAGALVPPGGDRRWPGLLFPLQRADRRADPGARPGLAVGRAPPDGAPIRERRRPRRRRWRAEPLAAAQPHPGRPGATDQPSRFAHDLEPLGGGGRPLPDDARRSLRDHARAGAGHAGLAGRAARPGLPRLHAHADGRGRRRTGDGARPDRARHPAPRAPGRYPAPLVRLLGGVRQRAGQLDGELPSPAAGPPGPPGRRRAPDRPAEHGDERDAPRARRAAPGRRAAADRPGDGGGRDADLFRSGPERPRTRDRDRAGAADPGAAERNARLSPGRPADLHRSRGARLSRPRGGAPRPLQSDRDPPGAVRRPGAERPGPPDVRRLAAAPARLLSPGARRGDPLGRWGADALQAQRPGGGRARHAPGRAARADRAGGREAGPAAARSGAGVHPPARDRRHARAQRALGGDAAATRGRGLPARNRHRRRGHPHPRRGDDRRQPGGHAHPDDRHPGGTPGIAHPRLRHRR